MAVNHMDQHFNGLGHQMPKYVIEAKISNYMFIGSLSHSHKSTRSWVHLTQK